MQGLTKRPNGDIGCDLQQVRTLVPLKDMSENHLLALLQAARIEVLCPGQQLFKEGQRDGEHKYLLSGNLALQHQDETLVQLSANNSFLPIAHAQPRTQSARALTDCHVLCINSQRLDEMLTWSQAVDYLQVVISNQRDLDEDIDWMMTVIRSNLFYKVPPLNVAQIFSRLQARRVFAGEVILRQGEIGQQCFFIKEGEAEVSCKREGTRVHLANIGVGRCFGEDALVNKTLRNATVEMRTDGVLMCLAQQDFIQLLKAPEVQRVALAELDAQRAQGAIVVDVRSDAEYSQGHLAQAVNIPLMLLALKARLLAQDKTYIVYCDSGSRSRAAAYLLAQQGYNTLALNDCPSLFAQGSAAGLLANCDNYVLRQGAAVLGHDLRD